MNYFNTANYNQMITDGNNNIATILPFTAYNEYEEQFIQVFSETVQIKHELDNIVFNSISTETAESSEVSEYEQTESELLESLQASMQNSEDENNQPSIEPLPLPEFEQSESNPKQEFQTIYQKLEQMANIRDDIDDFIEYLSDTYEIDINEPVDDLPFEVIDEIMTYCDYDPDTDGDFDISLSQHRDPDDTIIIPSEQIDRFRNLLEDFGQHIQRLTSLVKINGVSNERADSYYTKFQNIFKPTINQLVRLYKHNLKDFDEVLNDSIDYHNNQVLKEIDWDAEYSDHDY